MTAPLTPADAARLADLIVERTRIEREIAELLGAAAGDAGGPPLAYPGTLPPTWTCTRCGHVWHSIRDARPRYCARCHSAGWNRPPTQGRARTPKDAPNPKWRRRSGLPGRYRVLPSVDAGAVVRVSSGLPPPPGLVPPLPPPLTWTRPRFDADSPERIASSTPHVAPLAPDAVDAPDETLPPEPALDSIAPAPREPRPPTLDEDALAPTPPTPPPAPEVVAAQLAEAEITPPSATRALAVDNAELARRLEEELAKSRAELLGERAEDES